MDTMIQIVDTFPSLKKLAVRAPSFTVSTRLSNASICVKLSGLESLDICIGILESSSVVFTKLRHLGLHYFCGSQTIGKILHYCPVLDSLAVQPSTLQELQTIIMVNSSRTVKIDSFRLYFESSQQLENVYDMTIAFVKSTGKFLRRLEFSRLQNEMHHSNKLPRIEYVRESIFVWVLNLCPILEEFNFFGWSSAKNFEAVRKTVLNYPSLKVVNNMPVNEWAHQNE